MASGDDFILGQNNAASATTQLDGTVAGGPSMKITQASDCQDGIEAVGGPSSTKTLSGAGLKGTGGVSSAGGPIDPGAVPTGGYGVIGQGGAASDGAGGAGVWGIGGAGKWPNGGIGVIGWGGGPAAAQGDGVAGSTNSDGDIRAGVAGINAGGGPGVRGIANGGGKGVLGQSGLTGTGGGVGVYGQSGAGVGVQGAVSGGTGVGVRADNTAGGLGLAVHGRAGFSTCGGDTVAAGQASKAVANPAVTATSHISVTLTGNPGAAALVLWVERQPGTGFVVHLARPVVHSTPFSYLVVEPLSL